MPHAGLAAGSTTSEGATAAIAAACEELVGRLQASADALRDKAEKAAAEAAAAAASSGGSGGDGGGGAATESGASGGSSKESESEKAKAPAAVTWEAIVADVCGWEVVTAKVGVRVCGARERVSA